MKPSRPRNHLALALYLNAALLAGVLIVLLGRGPGPSILPAAYAQVQQPIAGGGGIFVMPAQLHREAWGCYLMDVDAQTLTVYQYYPGDRSLRLMAARHFRYDRQLKDFNTFPSPQEVQAMVEKEQDVNRVRNAPAPAPVDPEQAPRQE